MIDLLIKPHSLIRNHELVRGILATDSPEWLRSVRAEALRKFESVGLPTTKDEEFKYTPLRALHETDFAPAYGSTIARAEVEKTTLGKFEAITLAFVNGEYSPELSTQQILGKGVVIAPLSEAWAHTAVEQHLTKVATLESSLGSTNDERFVHLNTAYLGDGAFVFIPKGVASEHPIHLLFVSREDHGAFAAHPRTLIVLEDAAQAKIVESYVGLGGTYFTNAVTEVVVGHQSNLEHVRFQDETRESIHIGAAYVTQAADSVYTSNNFTTGAATARLDLNSNLTGEHTETWLNGAYVGNGEQILDNHTRIDHRMPNCNSFEVYKGILDEKAQGVFNGKIFVYEDAQMTDAKQTNQAILLAPTAAVNTKPQLEIFADDVKCTHGATVGQLREDAMFYLRARGIPAQEARALLVYAFAAEVLEKITIEPVRVALEQALFAKLNPAP